MEWKTHAPPRPVRGFTLIELLVSIAVIGLLTALLLAGVQQARESARRSECRSKLRQLGIALYNYESAHRVFPPSFVRQLDGSPEPPPGVPFGDGDLKYRGHWTGFHMLLPYIEQESLYDRYDFRQSWLSSLADPMDRPMWRLNRTVISLLLCPSRSRGSTLIGADSDDSTTHWMSGAPTDYSFSHGADIVRPDPDKACPEGSLEFWSQWPVRTRGPFGYNSTCRIADIRDGTSNTFLMGEKGGNRLVYEGSEEDHPTLPVDYPWSMAAHDFYAATGGEDEPSSFWVAGPYAATRDIRPPDCPSQLDRGVPLPMNPRPLHVPRSSNELHLFSFQSLHSGGATFLFADGSARFLGENIDLGVFRALSTIAGTEAIKDSAW